MGTRPTTTTGDGRSSREFQRFVEEHAAELRRRAGIGPLERLDPWAVAPKFGVIIPDLADLVGMSPEDRAHLGAVDAKAWSGGGISLPGGKLLVLLNPSQTAERAAATIMEEVAHVHLGHRPSLLAPQPNGAAGRRYDAQTEREAKRVAAAALLPAVAVARVVWAGTPAAVLAAEFGVSVELVEFRIKILGLWSEYRGHAA